VGLMSVKRCNFSVYVCAGMDVCVCVIDLSRTCSFFVLPLDKYIPM